MMDSIGGADRDRTDDLLSAIQALSQTELQPHNVTRENTAVSGRGVSFQGFGGADYSARGRVRSASRLQMPDPRVAT